MDFLSTALENSCIVEFYHNPEENPPGGTRVRWFVDGGGAVSFFSSLFEGCVGAVGFTGLCGV